MYWRQYPIDLLNDEKMGYIESMMPAGYEYAPYMYYITALKLANDDGIYDLDDGIIFARLMRVENVQLVFDVTNLMRKYKIIYRLSDDTQLCGIVDWSYSDKKKRTLAERKQAALNAIERERAKSMSTKDFGPAGCAGKCNDIPQSTACVGKCNDIPQGPGNNAPVPAQDAPEPAQSAVFFMPEDDKNRKNVVINADDDKNAENVTDIHTDSTNNTVQEVQTHTHIQQTPACGPNMGPTADVCSDSIPAVADIQNSETDNETHNEQAACSDEITQLAEQAMSIAGNSEETKSAVCKKLEDFFVKFCYGYDKKHGRHSVVKIADRICKLADDKNPADCICDILCKEFKKMNETGSGNPYWKGIALLPSNMLKDSVWSYLMGFAGRILAKQSKDNAFLREFEKYKADAEKEQNIVADYFDEEFRKYGIDPEDPDRVQKMFIARNAEQNGKQEEPSYDVF